MDTPIADFVCRYANENAARFHMPGHKGRAVLGCERLDITEIPGADTLYEASGIIARSEDNAAALFGSAGTFYATEGSSQCVKAMLALALAARPRSRVVVAARNVHRSFVHAAALLDFETVWLWPDADGEDAGRMSLCRCPVSAAGLERTLSTLADPPAAVYVTSPDYLGGMADIAGLSAVCHAHHTLLLVDNAHGAYLHFLPQPIHPLDLGADLCCDSAHKTLPVLTGGAYLHVAHTSPLFAGNLRQEVKRAMALFGSTSPSYLTLASLDRANASLAEDYPQRLAETVARLDDLKASLRARQWPVEASDPLRLTLRAVENLPGPMLAERLYRAGCVCEYAEDCFLVLMLTPENRRKDFSMLRAALDRCPGRPAPLSALPRPGGIRACSIRQAVFSPHEIIPTEQSGGRICAMPMAACPPAVPIVVAGEYIGPTEQALFCHFGVKSVEVMADRQSMSTLPITAATTCEPV